MNNSPVTLTIASNGNLVITPDSSIREEEDFLRSLSEQNALAELLEQYTCNGWDWVQPHECGALTAGPIISNDCSRDENGEVYHLGQTWWHSNYMVESAIDRLLEGREVIFTKVEEW